MVVARQRIGGVFCCVSGWVVVDRQRLGGVFGVLVTTFDQLLRSLVLAADLHQF